MESEPVDFESGAPNEKLRPADLLGLERYARERAELRTRVIAHKKRRTVPCGPNVTFCFEDRVTVQYQVQEMLRIERIFEAHGIAEELEAYNPLIPDGSNWKATLLVEFPEPEVRRVALAELKVIEDRCWVEVEGHERVYAIADEDLERENEEKTSSVHFVRFEFSDPQRHAIRAGAAVKLGCDHRNYPSHVQIVAETLASLAGDLSN